MYANVKQRPDLGWRQVAAVNLGQVWIGPMGLLLPWASSGSWPQKALTQWKEGGISGTERWDGGKTGGQSAPRATSVLTTATSAARLYHYAAC